MVGNGDKNFCDIYEQWKMDRMQQQQKEYYDSLEKKSKKTAIHLGSDEFMPTDEKEAKVWKKYWNPLNPQADDVNMAINDFCASLYKDFKEADDKCLNDYYNDILKQKTPTQNTADINEGYLWEEDIKRATKRKLDAIKKEDKAQKRKRMPVYSGVMQYFPDALLAVSECSMTGNNQHHEDKPLHWDRNKSNDHLDCLARHLIDADKIDDDGIAHLTKVAWRSLAALQIYLEENK